MRFPSTSPFWEEEESRRGRVGRARRAAAGTWLLLLVVFFPSVACRVPDPHYGHDAPLHPPKPVFFLFPPRVGLVLSYTFRPALPGSRLLEPCWLCIYRHESFSFRLCLPRFKELMRCVTMAACLDGRINKVTSASST